MALDLEAEITLLEQNRRIVAAQHRVAQAGFQPVPAGGQGSGDVAHVFVVHEQQRAQSVSLHALARPFQAVLSQPVPVDALLPVQSRNAEIRHLFLSRSDMNSSPRFDSSRPSLRIPSPPCSSAGSRPQRNRQKPRTTRSSPRRPHPARGAPRPRAPSSPAAAPQTGDRRSRAAFQPERTRPARSSRENRDSPTPPWSASKGAAPCALR